MPNAHSETPSCPGCVRIINAAHLLGLTATPLATSTAPAGELRNFAACDTCNNFYALQSEADREEIAERRAAAVVEQPRRDPIGWLFARLKRALSSTPGPAPLARCARPGCGHDAEEHEGAPSYSGQCHDTINGSPYQCKCTGFQARG
jgi:hypothetical protein